MCIVDHHRLMCEMRLWRYPQQRPTLARPQIRGQTGNPELIDIVVYFVPIIAY
jgi:hypothetical protein